MNPMNIKRGIDKAVDAAVESLVALAVPCRDSRAITQVGTVSANGDMSEMGILDPAEMVRVALQNAASIAGLMITTEAMIAELPKQQPAMPGEMERLAGYA